MAATVQTRITESAHKRIAKLSAETGKTPQEVMETALKRYERELFLARINEGYAALRADQAAWQAESEEREVWDTTVADGLDH